MLATQIFIKVSLTRRCQSVHVWMFFVSFLLMKISLSRNFLDSIFTEFFDQAIKIYHQANFEGHNTNSRVDWHRQVKSFLGKIEIFVYFKILNIRKKVLKKFINLDPRFSVQEILRGLVAWSFLFQVDPKLELAKSTRNWND